MQGVRHYGVLSFNETPTPPQGSGTIVEEGTEIVNVRDGGWRQPNGVPWIQRGGCTYERTPALLQHAQELRKFKPDNNFIMEERGRQEVLPLVKELLEKNNF